MASSDKTDRDKARAESRFRMEQSAGQALIEAARHARAEQAKTERLRALRLARDQAEAAVAPPEPAKKKAVAKKPVRRGIGG